MVVGTTTTFVCSSCCKNTCGNNRPYISLNGTGTSHGMFRNVDNFVFMYTDSVGHCTMLLICSTLVTKHCKMCRLLAAIIFINITMGWGGDGNNFMGMGMLLHPNVTL